MPVSIHTTCSHIDINKGYSYVHLDMREGGEFADIGMVHCKLGLEEWIGLSVYAVKEEKKLEQDFLVSINLAKKIRDGLTKIIEEVENPLDNTE